MTSLIFSDRVSFLIKLFAFRPMLKDLAICTSYLDPVFSSITSSRLSSTLRSYVVAFLFKAGSFDSSLPAAFVSGVKVTPACFLGMLGLGSGLLSKLWLLSVSTSYFILLF